MKTDILWIEGSFVDRQVFQLETMLSVAGKLVAKVQLNEKIEAVAGKKQLFYSMSVSFSKLFYVYEMVFSCNLSVKLAFEIFSRDG